MNGSKDETSASPADMTAQREALAHAFDRTLDPLAEYETRFETHGSDIDPFALFVADVLDPRGLSSGTLSGYRCTFRQWREHMADEDRHPACPNEEHVKSFVRLELDGKGNSVDTVKNKLRRLNTVYEYWQDDPAFPHPQDYNPIKLARSKVSFDTREQKEPPRITIEELRDALDGVTHVRNRAVIVMQLKLGLRAGEVCNIRLSEIDIQNTELQKHYVNLGNHPVLDGRQNALYIPHDREGNKSQRPRVLPLDDETRRVLIQYLLIRPDAGKPWLFLSQSHHRKLWNTDANDIWKAAFHPEYAETNTHCAVTSHYGRHRFSTYWKIQQDMNREIVQYMRGDLAGNTSVSDRAGIDAYLHTYYEDIRDPYLENIFKLLV
jgi:integrase/recombinase XerD